MSEHYDRVRKCDWLTGRMIFVACFSLLECCNMGMSFKTTARHSHIAKKRLFTVEISGYSTQLLFTSEGRYKWVAPVVDSRHLVSGDDVTTLRCYDALLMRPPWHFPVPHNFRFQSVIAIDFRWWNDVSTVAAMTTVVKVIDGFRDNVTNLRHLDNSSNMHNRAVNNWRLFGRVLSVLESSRWSIQLASWVTNASWVRTAVWSLP